MGSKAQSNGVIFVTYITDPKTGKRRYARDYGKRAWPIRINKNKK